jgi:hypothetical protein
MFVQIMLTVLTKNRKQRHFDVLGTNTLFFLTSVYENEVTYFFQLFAAYIHHHLRKTRYAEISVNTGGAWLKYFKQSQ